MNAKCTIKAPFFEIGPKSYLYGDEILDLAKAADAQGVILLLVKFCDPEEFDYVPVKRMLDAAGIPVLAVEIDQQMVNFEQAANAVLTFAEMLG